MKKFLLLTIVLSAAISISAQTSDSLRSARPDHINILNEKSEYLGYTIKLIPGTTGKYGFDISHVESAALHRFQNPLAFSQKGIQKKEDAYKIAQWIISQYERTGHWVNLVPPHIVNELKINLTN
jgi:hypothetical protein